MHSGPSGLATSSVRRISSQTGKPAGAAPVRCFEERERYGGHARARSRRRYAPRRGRLRQRSRRSRHLMPAAGSSGRVTFRRRIRRRREGRRHGRERNQTDRHPPFPFLHPASEKRSSDAVVQRISRVGGGENVADRQLSGAAEPGPPARERRAAKTEAPASSPSNPNVRRSPAILASLQERSLRMVKPNA